MPQSAAPQMSPRAWAELMVLALMWGASFFMLKIALAEVGPITIVLHRCGWAAVILWGWVWWRGLPVPRDARLWVGFAVMGFLNNALPFCLLSWGQTQIETGLASIFNATTALWGVLVASLLLRDERLTRGRLAGVLIGVAGVVVVKGPAILGAVDPRALGQYAVLAGALCYALAGVWGKTRLVGVAPGVAAAGMLSAAALWLAPVALLVEGVPRVDLGLPVLAALGYLVTVGTVGAFLLYYRLLATAGSGNVTLVTLLIPPIAIALGAIGFGERLAPNAYLGFAIIALGLAVIDGRALAGLRRLAGRGSGG